MLDYIVLGFFVLSAAALFRLDKFFNDLILVLNKLVDNNAASKLEQDRIHKLGATNEPAAGVEPGENAQKRKTEQVRVPEVDIEKIILQKPIRPAGGFGSRVDKSDID